VSKIKQALPEDVDVTEEGFEELEARGAVLVLDYPAFAREYNPVAAGMPRQDIDQFEPEQE
jgi:hypothetical protein